MKAFGWEIVPVRQSPFIGLNFYNAGDDGYYEIDFIVYCFQIYNLKVWDKYLDKGDE